MKILKRIKNTNTSTKKTKEFLDKDFLETDLNFFLNIKLSNQIS